MTDVLVLNSAVVDLRGQEFSFVEDLAGPGGLAKCPIEDMPSFSQNHYQDWILKGSATVGGPGNAAPLMAKAGLSVAVGVNLGKGGFGGLDAQGRFFYDSLSSQGIDMSQTFVHKELPTGTTFIFSRDRIERAGIAYFPNANDDFSLEHFRTSVERLKPKIVYYMYSGLSERGDANEGRDLALFVKWCRKQGLITIVDSHTLTGKPRALLGRGAVVEEYRLLEPLLGELDIFFTSADEARLIENTLGRTRPFETEATSDDIERFLAFITRKFWKDSERTRLLGVTVRDGAYHLHVAPGGRVSKCVKTTSHFSCGRVVDLTGAGDSFRAGMIAYVARHLESFRSGVMRFEEAVQMGNLFAALFIGAPLENRYRGIMPFERMLQLVRSERCHDSDD
jgi:sugar/nucleoside kinase (ribokinase family)